MSPHEFIQASKLFGGPERAALMIKLSSMPDLRQVAAEAEDEADQLICSDANVPIHARLMYLAMWAKRRVK